VAATSNRSRPFRAEDGGGVFNFLQTGKLDDDRAWAERSAEHAAQVVRPTGEAPPGYGVASQARFTPDVPGYLDDSATATQIKQYELMLSIAEEHSLTELSFLSFFLATMSPALKEQLKRQNSLVGVTVAYIVQWMKINYGTFNTADLVTIRARITKIFNPATAISEQLQNMASAQALLLHLAPDDRVSEFDMRQQFKANITGLSLEDQVQLCRLYDWYELSEPEHGQLTFAGLKNLINKRFHPSPTNQTMSSLGLVHSALGVVPRMYTQEELNAAVLKGPSATVAAAAAVAAPAKKQQFCFLHGHQSSHSGQQCRILKSNPALIDAIAKARGPATVGGFTSDSVGGVAISNRKAFKTAYSLN
jgi:hypothetical protein